jgi:hypothetical protein
MTAAPRPLIRASGGDSNVQGHVQQADQELDTAFLPGALDQLAILKCLKSLARKADNVPTPPNQKELEHFLPEAKRRLAAATDQYRGEGLFNMAKKKPKAGGGGKAGATDLPTWVRAKGEFPNVGESGRDFAKRVCDDEFGAGNYDTGPRSDFNQIKKWADQHLENP